MYYPIIVTWVTHPERPKGAKGKVKKAEGPQDLPKCGYLHGGPGGLLDFSGLLVQNIYHLDLKLVEEKIFWCCFVFVADL